MSIREYPTVLNEQASDEDQTRLGAATIRGDVGEVQRLLAIGGTKADDPSNGATPLLLAAWKMAEENRPQMVKLLLTKTPTSSVDLTCTEAQNKTPLMFAIEHRDVESIRLLRKAGASLMLESDDGINAEEMAMQTEDEAIICALNPVKEDLLAKIVPAFVALLPASKEALRQMYGLSPSSDKVIRKALDQLRSEETVAALLQEDSPLSQHFNGKINELFKKEMIQKAADLANDKGTCLGSKKCLPKTIQVSLCQQVIYCDDSYSMRREGRWASQRELAKEIAEITTKVLPDGEGVALRFINQDVDHSSNLTHAGISNILEPLSYKFGGETAIGTNLRTKILEPLVYRKLARKSLERPLLISVITDGKPTEEKASRFLEEILECGTRLDKAGYPRDSVKFMVGQVGTSESAKAFLEYLQNDARIEQVVYCIAEQMDAKFEKFRGNKYDLEDWLLERLATATTKKASGQGS